MEGGDLAGSAHSLGCLLGKTMERSADLNVLFQTVPSALFFSSTEGKTRIILVEYPIEMDLSELLVLEKNPVRDLIKTEQQRETELSL